MCVCEDVLVEVRNRVYGEVAIGFAGTDIVWRREWRSEQRALLRLPQKRGEEASLARRVKNS